ncbi:MAG: preprotein translocase subunit SecA [Candidatus Sumerlaeaceae bacterium]|nr:preprotein translocase subunit SecA [Candidatus Sumerlaeaceae bacterium]
MFGFITKLFGNKQARDMRKILPIVDEINAYYEEYQNLTDEELRAKTAEFKQRYQDGESLDDLLPEAFATIKDACRRHVGQKWEAAGIEITWDMIPFDVQLAGATVLHQGKIAEMATGEGKTLVAIMALYLNALAGEGVHLITVNDYLARRDSEWMGKIFEFLGLTIGCLDKTESSTPERRAMYECDITYGTNHEFGFDYLRDNMVHEANQVVQRRGHFFAIVDEVDNILIDEARTPLIISGPVDRSTHRYDEIKPIVFDLVRKQNELVNRLVSDAEKIMRSPEGLTWDAGLMLLRAQRGLPKHKKLAKIRGEAGVQAMIEKVELRYLGEKRMNEVDESLYYVIDEKGHQIDLTEMGRTALAPKNPKLWELPDTVEEIAAVGAGDYDVIELKDGRKVLLTGTKEERAAARKPNGDYEIHRHDGIQEVDAVLIERVVPGTESSPDEVEVIKEVIRAEHGVQSEKLHNIAQLLRAYSLYEKDVEYVVQDNKVVIVDEFTGRLMHGRRWSDGLHQAVECKEGVEIEIETQTLATVTLQNYFRMYKKLAGMTGTAETEAAEFSHTYKTDVVVVPTNRRCIRSDENDVIYKTRKEKYAAIIGEVERCHAEKFPVLVGTVSVEASELLSKMLQRKNIPHNVLNAKNHQREAEIVRFAGQPGAVTIATNMAGRGTDIKLHPDVIQRDDSGNPVAGGLQVIGTERHEARRIDRQLRGRSGRQGDPGRSKFFLSLEDDLMRLFGGERIARIMDRMGLQEGEEITHGLVTKSIERAQKKVETKNFEIRKRTLDYDLVMNSQREAIYGLRKDALMNDDLKELVLSVHHSAIREMFRDFGDVTKPIEDWDINGLLGLLQRTIPYAEFENLKGTVDSHDGDGLLAKIMERVEQAYDAKRAQLGDDLMTRLARWVILRRIDTNWIDHLLAIDELRESTGWRGYAQLDPINEFKREASLLFEDLLVRVHKEVLEHFFLTQPAIQQMEQPEQNIGALETGRGELEPLAGEAPTEEELEQMAEGDGNGRHPAGRSVPQNVPIRSQHKVGRNDPCPCGSGKKYKKCCGSAAGED